MQDMIFRMWEAELLDQPTEQYKKVCECEGCGDDICAGDEYYEVCGDCFCEECIQSMKKTAEEREEF